MKAHVLAVSVSPSHGFSKSTAAHITLLAGLGVEGDARCGTTVKHRSRVARDPTQPNLRQVHLPQAELFDELLGQASSWPPADVMGLVVSGGVVRVGDAIEVALPAAPHHALVCV